MHLLLTKNLYSTVCLHILQVLAACLYPQLINSDKLPVDVRQRAQKLLESVGGSVGKGCVGVTTAKMLKSHPLKLQKNFYFSTEFY